MRAWRAWRAVFTAGPVAALSGALAAHWTAPEALPALPVLVGARLLCARLFRFERLPWGRLGLQDAATAAAATAAGTVLAGLAAPVAGLWLPPALLAVDAALELSAGFTFEGLRQLRRESRAARAVKGRRRALIYGAGERGRALARAWLLEPSSAYVAVGFLDDDPDRRNTLADGLPVLGPIGALPFAAELVGAGAVVCAVNRPNERLEDLAEQAAVHLLHAAEGVETLDGGGPSLAKAPRRDAESAAA